MVYTAITGLDKRYFPYRSYNILFSVILFASESQTFGDIQTLTGRLSSEATTHAAPTIVRSTYNTRYFAMFFHICFLITF